MRDLLPIVRRWSQEGHRCAIATVVQTWGSSPRQVGACMGIRDDRLVSGSVSGGCVETAVIDEALNALHDGRMRQMKFDSISDEAAWEVGLSCGGSLQVWIDPCPFVTDVEGWEFLYQAVSKDESCLFAYSLEPEYREFRSLGQASEQLQYPAITGLYQVGDREWFVNVLNSRERLIIVGAVHIAVPLVAFANQLGFETIVIDPRLAFANPERFVSRPTQIISKWPNVALESIDITQNSYAVVLTHDPKIDNPALVPLLRSSARYIGALGSRKTQERRRAELIDLGLSDDAISKIHGPIGLKIGAVTPEEIALSIIAEIVQVRRAKS